MFHRLHLAAVLSLVAVAACAAPSSETDEAADVGGGEDALVAASDNAWFYGGPLPQLASPTVTVSLTGHTARVTGFVPAGTELPDMPHLRTSPAGAQTRVDLVYPIATARPGKSNSSEGWYSISDAKPYRPNGEAVTAAEGVHDVPWGGFPFLPYNSGIALHGPITDQDNKSSNDASVWYLERGDVSGGCNRMMGEHVVELAHVVGLSMRKVYTANRVYPVRPSVKVHVVKDYDTFGGKKVDVDYPTGPLAKRPGKVYGEGMVEMFGSWLASETPDGKDLPQDEKWQGGVAGAWYVFGEHVRPNMVCSVPKADLPRLATFASRFGGELPASFCAKKACVLSALRAGADAASCGL